MTIGFEEIRYTAAEPDGVIEVAVAVLNGELSTAVEVRITTMDGTARSE